MTIDNDRIVASAKKAARRMARTTDASYQTCLDTVARSAGRDHWGAFLADPVDVVLRDAAGDPDTKVASQALLDDGIDEFDDPIVKEKLRIAVEVVSDAIRAAVRLGRDAIGHERGRLRSWRVGEPDETIPVPEGITRCLHRAITLIAGADIRQEGPFVFDFEGTQMALIAARSDALIISLKGPRPVEWFGRFRPGDRIEADGTVIKAAEPKHRPMSPFSRAVYRKLGLARSIVTSLGRGIENAALRQAVKRHILSNREEHNGYSLGRLLNGPDVFLKETIPVHVSAPPGTGKTAGTVMPAILTADHSSLVIHDRTRLWEMTSGHRQTLGPVHVLDFGGRSNSSLNPLHEDWVPKDATARGVYVSRLADAIHPENDYESAYMAEAIHRTLEIESDPSFEKVAALLAARVEKRGGDEQEARKAFLWLTPLLAERVVACTTAAGLRPEDLRGVPSSVNRAWNPVTVYLVAGRHGSGSGTIGAVLQTAIWHHALGHAPGEEHEDGSRTGPLAVTMILDGCEELGPMPMLGFALEKGRSTKVGHMLVSNTTRGIPKLFAGRLDHDAMSLFSVRVVLCQNDVKEAASISKRFDHISVAQLCSMPSGRHLLIAQTIPEPMWMRTPFFFENPVLLRRTYNPRTGLGPPPVVLAKD